jgi:hypothetical protein
MLYRSHLAWCLQAMGATRAAIEELRKSLDEPTPWVLFPLALLQSSEDTSEALINAEHAVRLAPWHGFTTPLLMSFVALLGGAALYLALRGYLARGVDGTPFIPRVDARRIFDAALVTVSWRWARRLERLLGTRRLQPQLRWVVLFTLAVALWPISMSGLTLGAPISPRFDPAFALVWALGAACAVAAASLEPTTGRSPSASTSASSTRRRPWGS